MGRKRTFTTIKPRHLPDTWVDKDRLVVHLVFEVLSQFIEDECPGERLDWDADPERASAWREMNDLYDWWNNVYLPFDKEDRYLDDVERPKIVTRKCKDLPGARRVSFKYSSPEAEAKANSVMRARREREEEMERELTERCKRVIGVRRFMWT
jgi:hypothetical protein